MTKSTPARPPIILAESDAERLSGMAATIEARNPTVAAMLHDEIDRATIVADDAVPANVVRINSKVEFIDDGTGRTRTVELVMPVDTDIEAGRISVLTPIGAGLIGLQEGQTIDWPDRAGQSHELRIVKVTQ